MRWRQQVAQAVRDARRVARIAQHRGRRAAQTDALVDSSQQQHSAVRADVAALEIGLDHASTNTPKSDPSHRYTLASAVLGCHWRQIPMTTRASTRLPTLFW